MLKPCVGCSHLALHLEAVQGWEEGGEVLKVLHPMWRPQTTATSQVFLQLALSKACFGAWSCPVPARKPLVNGELGRLYLSLGKFGLTRWSKGAPRWFRVVGTPFCPAAWIWSILERQKGLCGPPELLTCFWDWVALGSRNSIPDLLLFFLSFPSLFFKHPSCLSLASDN